ncbi:MAG TPA: hypothetical protein VGD65_02740 [Chryseosolibacter sp.]
MPFLSSSFRKPSIFLLTVLFLSCGKQAVQEQKTGDTTAVEPTVNESVVGAATEEDPELSGSNPEFIKFYGTADDEWKRTLESIPAFDEVYQAMSEYTKIQDSLESERKLWGQQLTDPNDTSLVFPYKQKAYQAILNYKTRVANGLPVNTKMPTLFDLTRIPEPGDSSLQALPEAEPSKMLAAGDFFFLGGMPFLSKLAQQDDNNFFTDDQGNPETRFGMTLQDNVGFLLNSVSAARKPPINITYGPPLHTYEMGEIEVYGIGSLVHNFVGRVPAFFITEEGLIPAELLSVRLNLGAAYDCGSGSAYVEFACPKSIEEGKILAIYIPYGANPRSSTFARLNDHVWTADLNSDGIADFACVTNTYMGDMGYVIAEALWYANINGSWKIVDWAEYPECT